LSFPLPPQSLESRLDQVEQSQARLDAFEFGSRVFFAAFLLFAWIVPWICTIVILKFR